MFEASQQPGRVRFKHRFWEKAQHVQIQNVSNTTLASLKPIIKCKDPKHLHVRLHLIKPDRQGRSSTLHFLSPTCQTVCNEGTAQVKVHSRRLLLTGVCFHSVSVIPSACACSCCYERRITSVFILGEVTLNHSRCHQSLGSLVCQRLSAYRY